MGLKAKQIDDLKRTLAALPAKQHEELKLTVRDVVRLLADEITLLQARGYTAAEIAQIACTHNVQLSVHTLRRYLSEVRAGGKATSKRLAGRTSTSRAGRKSHAQDKPNAVPATEVTPVSSQPASAHLDAA